MNQIFTHGYALLIGVGTLSYSAWSLPVTAKDAKAIRAILTDSTLCSYPNDDQHIRLQSDSRATRDAIIDGLKWLKSQAVADTEATIIVYYSGHGWLNQATNQYYLLPYDVKPFDIPGSALAATTFIAMLREISAKRLLVFIDSCHAEGMATAKSTDMVELPENFTQIALPKNLVNEIKQGEGRAVFTSSRGKQRSWIRPDGTMSIYTYHLVEALQGAGNHPGDTVVRLSNLMNHLSKTVPSSAKQLCQAEQTPFFDTATEDFPVAMLRGGKGLPSGGWETIEQEVSEKIHQLTISIDQRSGGVYFENQGPIHITGDVVGHDQIEHN